MSGSLRPCIMGWAPLLVLAAGIPAALAVIWLAVIPGVAPKEDRVAIYERSKLAASGGVLSYGYEVRTYGSGESFSYEFKIGDAVVASGTGQGGERAYAHARLSDFPEISDGLYAVTLEVNGGKEGGGATMLAATVDIWQGDVCNVMRGGHDTARSEADDIAYAAGATFVILGMLSPLCAFMAALFLLEDGYRMPPASRSRLPNDRTRRRRSPPWR